MSLAHLMHILYRVLLSMRAVPREMIFCSSVVLMLLGILLLVFCKLNSLLLKPKSSNNLRSSCCFHFPYFLDFLQDLYIASRAFLLFSKKYCIHFFRKLKTYVPGLFLTSISLLVWIGMSQSIVTALFSVIIAGSCAYCSIYLTLWCYSACIDCFHCHAIKN